MVSKQIRNKNNYVLFYLIRGKYKKIHQKLVKEVGPKFGENYMIENPLPSHIALKYPFNLGNSKKLEQILNKFVKKQKQGEIKINGFGNFRRFVTFINTKFSKSALKTQKELIKELKKIGIESHKFDKKFRPHATIAYCNTKESFDKVWNYLKTLKEPKFTLKFDNIAILERNGKYWKIYKVFNIK